MICPDCSTEHDPRPCADEGGMCDCCASMFPDDDARAAACDELDRLAVPYPVYAHD